tara:strand:- start:42 stop:695 length:654 start_codon:yes stop_codon:yes gene_type:complete
MTWWRIVKQGKILTLPKTAMRIKQPKKEIEDKDCNRKLKAYADKLKNLPHDSLRPWMQNRDYIELDGRRDHYYMMTGWGIHKSKTENKQYHEFVSIEQTDFLYGEIPELVACKLLDLIEQHGDSDTWDGEFNAEGYNYGVINKMEYLTEFWDDRWEAERTAYAIPQDETIEPIHLKNERTNYGKYTPLKNAVFLRRIIECNFHKVDKGFTSVDISWK